MLDKSGSMDTKDDGKKSRWENLLDQVKNFLEIRQASESDLISIIFYESRAQIEGDQIKINDAFKVINKAGTAGGGTDFENALRAFETLMKNEKKEYKSYQKKVLFLSDGEDGSDKNKVDKLLQEIDNTYAG